jgi:protein-arginine deiminase
VQQCDDTALAWGPCEGEVTPQDDDCRTAEDEDCDGRTPPCPPGYPVVDLRADVNRNGVVDLDAASEDDDEETWDADHGAIFLANLDDDELACPVVEDDDELAACHDAADERVNGDLDRLDLAELRTVPWPEAPADASAAITLNANGEPQVRLFREVDGELEPHAPGTVLSADALREGIVLAIEGTDLVRDANRWDGYVDVTLEVEGSTGPEGPWPDLNDTVRLRLAPVLFRHHLHDAEVIYVSHFEGWPASEVFVDDVAQAVDAAAVPQGLVRFTDVVDQWTQDYLETAYMSRPSATGQHVMHVNFRSPNYRGNEPRLRAAGRVVFTHLRGRDVAGAVQYDPDHPDEMDSLNSFGNLETIPPYDHDGAHWPAGRVLLGSSPTYYPDPSLRTLVESQGVQDPVTIDTEWLLVGHVDETVSFVKAPSTRGWVLLAADPASSRAMLAAECDVAAPASTPNCDVEMFLGKWWSLNQPATASIYDVLSDPDVMNTSAWAAVEIDEQVERLRSETGLDPSEILPVPVLFQPIDGKAVAYQPNTVNSFVINRDHFAAARTHGPLIDGQDPYAAQLEAALGGLGITVHWIEDWDWYHRYDGDVHCGMNATRLVPPSEPWWEGGTP